MQHCLPWTIHLINCSENGLWTCMHGSAKKWMIQMLSHVLFHSHPFQSLSADSCPRNDKCTAAFWLFSSVFASYFIHTLNNSADGVSWTYLWLKLFSFLRQWRVTTRWPSLLTSWLTVHITGLLARAPRNATPSFSFTLQQSTNKPNKHIKSDDSGTVTRATHKLSVRAQETHMTYFALSLSFSLSLTHTQTHQRKEMRWGGALTASHKGHKTNPWNSHTHKKVVKLANEQKIMLDKKQNNQKNVLLKVESVGFY